MSFPPRAPRGLPPGAKQPADPSLDERVEEWNRALGSPAAHAPDPHAPGPHAPSHAPDPDDAPVFTTEPAAWRPVVLDRPIAESEPRPPSGLSYRPDTLLDGWSTERLTVRLASVRGYWHRGSGRPREDDVVAAVHPETGAVVFAVADGVSAAQQPHLGATLAARTAVDSVLDQLKDGRGLAGVEWRPVLENAAWALLDHASRVLGRPGGPAGHEEAARLLGTTLVAGLVAPAADGRVHAALVRVGDSNAWVLRRRSYTTQWEQQSAAESDVASTAVRPLPFTDGLPRPRGFELRPDEVLLVGTDGFGSPLGDGTGLVGQLFADHLAAPPPPRVFAHLLDFSRESFDDDRTLLAIWHRSRLLGER